MNADVNLFDLAYVGVMVGSMVLLALFWYILPRLLREEVTKADIPTGAPLLPARESSIRVGHALPQP